MTHLVQRWDPPRRTAPQSLHLPGPSGGLPDRGRLTGPPALPAHAPLNRPSHLPFQDSCWSTAPKLLDLHPACLLQGLHHPDIHPQSLVTAGGVPLCVWRCPTHRTLPGLPLHLGSYLRLIPTPATPSPFVGPTCQSVSHCFQPAPEPYNLERAMATPPSHLVTVWGQKLWREDPWWLLGCCQHLCPVSFPPTD